MRKLFFGIKVSLVTALVVFSVMSVDTLFDRVSVTARVKQGSDSEKVVLVQEKLKEFGLYDGKCDGVYDIDTADAVKRFQEYNGLYADGVCGNETLMAMGLAIYSYTDFEMDILARLIEAEAGDTDLQTMTAVGGVVLNRVEHDGFPDSILQVIYTNGSFSSVMNGKIDKVHASKLAYRAAEDALVGVDPSEGALYVMHGGSFGRIVTVKSGDIYFGK